MDAATDFTLNYTIYDYFTRAKLLYRQVFRSAFILSCFAASLIIPLLQARLGLTMASPAGWNCRGFTDASQRCGSSLKDDMNMHGAWLQPQFNNCLASSDASHLAIRGCHATVQRVSALDAQISIDSLGMALNSRSKSQIDETLT